MSTSVSEPEELEVPETAVAEPEAPKEPAPKEPSTLAHVGGLQGYGVVVLGVVISIAALSLAEGFFVPVVVALVISISLARIVRALARVMPRWIASALVVTALIAGLGSLAYVLSDETARAIAELPSATRNLRQMFRVLLRPQEGVLRQLQQAIGELQKTASESTERPSTPSGVTAVQVVEPPVDITNMVWLGSQGVLWLVAQLTLVVFLVYFLLAYGDLFKRKLVILSGESLSRRKVTVQLIDQVGEQVTRSLSHLVLASLIVGIATAISLSLLEVRYAGLWGLAAGLLNFVPYVGPLVVAAGLFLMGLTQFGDIGMAAIISGISMFITSVEGFVFTPIVFGRSARINPVAVFIGFFFWGWLWGIWGMLLAMPLLMVLKTVAENVEDLRPVAELLSD